MKTKQPKQPSVFSKNPQQRAQAWANVLPLSQVLPSMGVAPQHVIYHPATRF
jgi:hypothetical protein